MLFDGIASVYFIWKMYLYFIIIIIIIIKGIYIAQVRKGHKCIGNSQPSEPALCQLYRHTFVPYIQPPLLLLLL